MFTNKLINFFLLNFFFPFFLMGYSITVNAQSSENKVNSITDIEKSITSLQEKYNKFSQHIIENPDKPDQNNLLNQLEKESKNDKPQAILEGESNSFKQTFDDFEALKTDIETFKTTLENSSITPEEKSKYQTFLTPLNNQISPTTSDENNLTLSSIVTLLEDNKLNKTEICEQIQKPLKIITKENLKDCGKFNTETYQDLVKFFTEENKKITEQFTIISNPTSVTENNDNSSTATNTVEITPSNKGSFFQKYFQLIISVLFGLMLIGLVLLTYLLFNLYDKFLKHQSIQTEKVKSLETENKTKKEEIKILQAKITELKIEFDRQFSKMEAYLSQIESQRNYTLTQQSNPSQNNVEPEIIAQNNDFVNSLEEKKSEICLEKDDSESAILTQSYKSNPNNLLKNAIQVRMTKETTNNVIDGTWNNIVEFEQHRTGEYFIINSKMGEIYLFLNPTSVFNPQTLQIINKSQLFVCHGDFIQSLKGEEISIVKPATVKEDKEKWLLVESGEIILS